MATKRFQSPQVGEGGAESTLSPRVVHLCGVFTDQGSPAENTSQACIQPALGLPLPLPPEATLYDLQGSTLG